MLTQWVSQLDDWMYTWILMFLLTGAGAYFFIRTGFVQLRRFPDALRALAQKPKGEKQITPFRALMVSTASRVGIGNIAGVSTAIALGGAGSVFWMWLLAILGGASSFMESTLGQLYKVRDGDVCRGGPSYYIDKGLHSKTWAKVFGIFLVLTCGFGGNALQAYNIMDALRYYVPASLGMKLAVGLVLTVLCIATISGGSYRISRISSVIVPVMAGLYLLLSLTVVALHIQELPGLFREIFRQAFDFQAIFGGFTGSCMVYGMKRGLFSNEAGMGSAPNATSSAETDHPVSQGLSSVVSVFIDTILICTATALILLIYDGGGNAALKGVPYVQQALASQFGQAGIAFLTLAIFLFAFTSIIGNYFYAENGLRYLTRNPKLLKLFRSSVFIMVFFGAQMSFELAWGLADVFMGCMTIINLIAVFRLRKQVYTCLENYEQQRKAGLSPVFRAKDTDIAGTECW